MSRLVIALLSLVLLSNTAAAATASAVSVSSSVFNHAPVKVFDTSNASDSEWTNIPYTGVTFSAGATNSTLWAWGATVSSNEITTITMRKLNATIISFGNDTTEASSLGDSQITGLTIASIKPAPVFASGPGYLAIVNVGPDTTANAAQQVWLTVVAAGGSTVSTTQLTATGADSTSGSTTTSTDFNIGSVWYENGYFYVTYVTVASSTTSGTTTYTETTVTLQAVAAANSSLLYTAPGVSVVSTLTNVLTGYSRGSTVTATYAYAGGTNYTNSTYVYVLYKDSTNAETYVVPVTRSSGSVGTATLLQTDTAGSMVYQPAGVFYSNYTYGIALSNATTVSGTTTYSLITYSNSSWTTDSDSGISFSSASGPGITVSGTLSGTGYLLMATYPTASSGTGYVDISHYANGTVNGSSISIGTIQGVAAQFVDANGALWFGYANYDSSQSSPYPVYQGYLGNLVGQVYATTSTYGAVLVSFFTLLSLLLASIFTF